ncbi:MAG: sugar ABC transporter permease [Oscillospiraceae bacterium]|jgi:arabinosaccharide transport system permease protein|nr:sugar ABC transporter permease [Oscillospiraceae bacterium]
MTVVRRFLYSKKIAPYVFILPFVLTFAVFFIYPLASTIRMSFQDILPGQVQWVGLSNYRRLLGDKVFGQAVFNSVRYMLITCALLIPFPMLFAYMISSKSMKSAGFFKSLYFVPVLTSVVVAGLVFRMMFSELPGALMNSIRGLFGKPAIYWMKNEYSSLLALILLCCWRWTGMNMLYFMAGMKSIPNELYEAAEIDGANTVRKFTHVTWPLLKPTTIYVLTISIYAGLAMFTESYMVFGNNTSPHNYGLTIVGYLYRYGFEKLRMGYASAVGLALLVGAMVINVAQLYITGAVGPRRTKV